MTLLLKTRIEILFYGKKKWFNIQKARIHKMILYE